jgi:hypothetical protein
MGIHEAYAKRLLRGVFGDRFDDAERAIRDDPVVGTSGIKIDGVIDSQVAVEIVSGTAKVVAADADRLLRHPLPFKLLVIVPVGQHNPETARQRAILNMSRQVDASRFRVVALQGTGHNPLQQQDLEHLRAELLNWPRI